MNVRVRCASQANSPGALALRLALPEPPTRAVPGSPAPPPPPPRLSGLSSRRQLSGPRQLRALPPPVALSAVGAGADLGQPCELGSSGVEREK